MHFFFCTFFACNSLPEIRSIFSFSFLTSITESTCVPSAGRGMAVFVPVACARDEVKRCVRVCLCHCACTFFRVRGCVDEWDGVRVCVCVPIWPIVGVEAPNGVVATS